MDAKTAFSLRLRICAGMILGLAIACLSAPNVALAQATVAAIKQKGAVNCGTTPNLPGFSATDSTGKNKGIDVDICRAVAAAILKDAEKVKYIPVASAERFTSLQTGVIDILSAASSWTYTRNTKLALEFTAVNFYTGSAFLVKKSLSVESAKKLNGATICDVQGSTNEHAVADFNKVNNIKINLLVFDDLKQVVAALQAGRCDGYVNDVGTDAILALQLKGSGEDYVILPEIISKNPQGPFTRQGDEQFYNIVKFSFYAMVTAEEMGLTSANVDKMRETATDPSIRKFLGLEGDLGPMLGLDKDCYYQIVKQVGNYGESFEKNLGMEAPLKLHRGLNALWTNGGLLYSPPFD
jgi:general L-amino acid transport system substrate-binding protein